MSVFGGISYVGGMGIKNEYAACHRNVLQEFHRLHSIEYLKITGLKIFPIFLVYFLYICRIHLLL